MQQSQHVSDAQAGRKDVAHGRRLLALAGLLLALAIGVYIMASAMLPADFELSGEGLAAYVASLGMWGHAAIMGLMVVHSFVPFPAEFVAFAAGMCFGPLMGTVVVWTGAMAGAVLSFGLARAFGRPFVEAMLPARHRRRLDTWSHRQGASTLLIVRFIPVIAFNLVNYAAGLTRVSWATFLWTTGLGILPLTALMVILGDQMRELAWYWWLALAVGAFVLWIVVERIKAHRAGRQPVSARRSA